MKFTPHRTLNHMPRCHLVEALLVHKRIWEVLRRTECLPAPKTYLCAVGKSALVCLLGDISCQGSGIPYLSLCCSTCKPKLYCVVRSDLIDWRLSDLFKRLSDPSRGIKTWSFQQTIEPLGANHIRYSQSYAKKLWCTLLSVKGRLPAMSSQ